MRECARSLRRLSLSSYSYTSHSPFCHFVPSLPSYSRFPFFQLTHMDMEEMVTKSYEILRIVHCFWKKISADLCKTDLTDYKGCSFVTVQGESI